MKPWQAAVLDFVTYSSPNLAELRSMYHSITSNAIPSSSTLGEGINIGPLVVLSVLLSTWYSC